ncbi:hypothetical protein ACH4M4_37920 [Streptomyces sp. NPDC017254]
MSVSKEIGRTVRTAIERKHRTGRLIAILVVTGVIVMFLLHGHITVSVN